jgi:hypothetical protein
MVGTITGMNWSAFGAQMGAAFAAAVAGVRVPLGPMPAPAAASGFSTLPSTGGDNPKSPWGD